MVSALHYIPVATRFHTRRAPIYDRGHQVRRGAGQRKSSSNNLGAAASITLLSLDVETLLDEHADPHLLAFPAGVNDFAACTTTVALAGGSLTAFPGR